MRLERDEPLPISRFDYRLPPELIAQTPLEPRDAARLLVIDRATGKFHDRNFRDMVDYLLPRDLLVLNDTRVMPSRIHARRSTGGLVELLLLVAETEVEWIAVAKPARRLQASETLTLLDRRGHPTALTATLVSRDIDTVRLRFSDVAALDDIGEVPLPPYIRGRLDNPERYQTIYNATRGSAAAPTAGLHFTSELLERCRRAGASTTTITLHVGLDTFQPIRTEDARDHRIHSEAIAVSSEAILDICRTRRSGGRVIAVGTTAVRTLETISDRIGEDPITEISQSTKLYITPSYRFKVVDALVTNFHLPRTSLLLLVSAFAGEELIRRAYQHAITARYRFYSFGDAMLIV